jgi:hypothetical protein
MKPIIYPENPNLQNGTTVIDGMRSAVSELFFIDNPGINKNQFEAEHLDSYIQQFPDPGVWVYYPWRSVVVHVPNEETYQRIRTARNRNLILPDEQNQYRNTVVGIAGLSVGSTALATLVATGGPKRLKLADPDMVEISNLNRMRATLLDIGQNKATVAARTSWEVDPFLNLETWDQGVARESLEKFILEPKLDIFVDEMDAIDLKFMCRDLCKKNKIPVVMATDNGDGIILDVERFDIEPDRKIFHGRVHIDLEEMRDMTREKFVAMANDIIDPTLFTIRQQQSIMEIGKTLSGVAQLGSAAVLAGAAVSFAVRRLATGQAMPSGRYTMSCEAAFIPEYESTDGQTERAIHTKKFIDAFRKKE